MTQPTAKSGAHGRLRCHSWLRLVLVCACLLGSLLTSRASFALALVPMCGEHAETVAAPPVSRAAEEVPLGPKGCNEKGDRRFDTRGHVPLPSSPSHVDVVPRLPPLRYRLSPAPRVRGPIEFHVSGERPGYQRALERPPR